MNPVIHNYASIGSSSVQTLSRVSPYLRLRWLYTNKNHLVTPLQWTTRHRMLRCFWPFRSLQHVLLATPIRCIIHESRERGVSYRRPTWRNKESENPWGSACHTFWPWRALSDYVYVPISLRPLMQFQQPHVLCSALHRWVGTHVDSYL